MNDTRPLPKAVPVGDYPPAYRENNVAHLENGDVPARRGVTIVCDTTAEAMRIATSMHEQIAGNSDYVNSAIILHTSEATEKQMAYVQYVIFDDAVSDPHITITL